MESHGSLRLLPVFLCLAISIGGARSRLGPDVSTTPEPTPSRLGPNVSPTPEPAASRLVPDVSPTPKPTASRLVPDVSPTPEPVASRLAPDVSPTSASQLAPHISLAPEPSASASPFPSQDIPYEAIGLFVNSPAESAVVDEAAELVAELDVPSLNEQSPVQSGSVNEAAMLVAALGVPPAKELVDGVDVAAALDSLDENTLITLPFTL